MGEHQVKCRALATGRPLVWASFSFCLSQVFSISRKTVKISCFFLFVTTVFKKGLLPKHIGNKYWKQQEEQIKLNSENFWKRWIRIIWNLVTNFDFSPCSAFTLLYDASHRGLFINCNLLFLLLIFSLLFVHVCTASAEKLILDMCSHGHPLLPIMKMKICWALCILEMTSTKIVNLHFLSW